MTLEEICRELLAAAIKNKLVTMNYKRYRAITDLSAGNLVVIANTLSVLLDKTGFILVKKNDNNAPTKR